MFNGFNSSTGLQLNGTAGVADGKLRLTTTGQTDRAAAAWLITPQDVTQSFTTSVRFTITDPGVQYPLENGADGLALVLHNDLRSSLDQVLGMNGSGIGYTGEKANPVGITRSLGIMFNTAGYARVSVVANGDDPAMQGARSVAIQPNGWGYIIGTPQTLTLVYDAGSEAITVLRNGTSIGMDNVPLGQSLASLVGGDTAVFGLTGATGAGSATIDVGSFSAGAAVPEPTAVGVLAIAGVLAAGRRSARR